MSASSPGILAMRTSKPPHTDPALDFAAAPPMTLVVVWPNVVLASSSLPDLEAVLASTILGEGAAHLSLNETAELPESEV